MILVVASGNEHKVKEIAQILDNPNIELRTAKEYGVNVDEAEENGKTFKENALIKARFLKERVDECVIADDSGLIIEALDILGVHTARFHNELDYPKRHEIVLKMLENEENKKAKFVCSIAFINKNGEEFIFEGESKGEIRPSEGLLGFGYDPIFFSYDLNTSFAACSPSEKNSVSHRGRALKAFKEFLAKGSANND